MVLVVLLVMVLLVPFKASGFSPAPAQEIFEPAPVFLVLHPFFIGAETNEF
jgi:hypothetical protein